MNIRMENYHNLKIYNLMLSLYKQINLRQEMYKKLFENKYKLKVKSSRIEDLKKHILVAKIMKKA